MGEEKEKRRREENERKEEREKKKMSRGHGSGLLTGGHLPMRNVSGNRVVGVRRWQSGGSCRRPVGCLCRRVVVVAVVHSVVAAVVAIIVVASSWSPLFTVELLSSSPFVCRRRWWR